MALKETNSGALAAALNQDENSDGEANTGGNNPQVVSQTQGQVSHPAVQSNAQTVSQPIQTAPQPVVSAVQPGAQGQVIQQVQQPVQAQAVSQGAVPQQQIVAQSVQPQVQPVQAVAQPQVQGSSAFPSVSIPNGPVAQPVQQVQAVPQQVVATNDVL